MEIRSLEYADLERASALLWKSFYETEKHNFSLRGMEKFRDATGAVSLSMSLFRGEICLYGAFESDVLCGVGAVKGENHILLLYVLPECFHQGIGSALLSHMLARCRGARVTVNASDSAVPFYEKRGFLKVGDRREEEDFIFTPMEKTK